MNAEKLIETSKITGVEFEDDFILVVVDFSFFSEQGEELKLRASVGGGGGICYYENDVDAYPLPEILHRNAKVLGQDFSLDEQLSDIVDLTDSLVLAGVHSLASEINKLVRTRQRELVASANEDLVPSS